MTSPLSPEAVAQMVAELPSRWADTAPKPHHCGEELLPIVYADPGSNGWYYRERKPDSVTVYIRVDLVATLAAENTTLRAERDALDQRNRDLIDASGQQCGCGYDTPTDVCLGHLPMVSALRASEAAALERVAELLTIIDRGRQDHLSVDDCLDIEYARALTPTADKEPTRDR